MLKRAMWSGWNWAAKRMARAYVAGPHLSDALAVCRRIADRGFRTTVGYWDDGEEDPSAVAETYRAALDALQTAHLDAYLSVKLPALAYSRELLERVLDKARQTGRGIHFDSLGPETVDDTWQTIETIDSHGLRLGCTLPARWARSPDDALWAARRGLCVRVVKGQWEDLSRPRTDPRAGFLAVIDGLAGVARQVSVATHDAELAEKALQRLEDRGTPRDLELLYGLPARRSLSVAEKTGIAVRFYVPYGDAWLPYCLSQIRRRPRLIAWIARDYVASAFGRGGPV
ncbi:MAG: proline dehydrogenase [Acidobacteriota bacterium]|nr:MAG: proline dehydrogenase [Acidobacteriota bacterium]